MAKSKRNVVKRVKGATLYDDGLIKIENVRCSYPHLDRPYAGNAKGKDQGRPAYSMTALLDKKKHKEAFLLVRDELRAKIKELKVKDIPDDKKCLRDGDKSGKDTHEGCWTLSAREVKAPILRDADNEPVSKDDANDVFYGGCYVDVAVRLWSQNNEWGKRVNCNLLMVKFRSDGEAFGEGRISDDDADELFGDGSDDDDDDSGYDEDDEDEKPARGARSSKGKPARGKRSADDDDDDADDEDDEDEDDEDEDEKPSRSRRAAKGKPASRGRRRPADDDEDEDDDDGI